MRTRSLALFLGAVLAAAMGVLLALLQHRTPGQAGGAAREAGRPQTDVRTGGGGPGAAGRPGSRPPSFLPPAGGASAATVLERARKEGVPLIDVYRTEPRDPVWAPAMERALRARFDAKALPEWLRPLSVEEMECRASACQFVLSYPASLDKDAATRAAAEGLPPDTTPLGYLVIETGSLAAMTKGVSTEQVAGPDGSPVVKRTQVVAFGADDHDPASYGAWVEARKQRDAGLRQRMIDGWRAKQATLGRAQRR